MKIYKRYCDKASFFIFTISLVVIFFFCIGVFAYEFLYIDNFYTDLNECYLTQSFSCMAHSIAEYNIAKDNLLLVLSINISFIGAIFGFLIVVLYRDFKLYIKDRNEAR